MKQWGFWPDPLGNPHLTWVGKREAMEKFDIRVWPSGIVEFWPWTPEGPFREDLLPEGIPWVPDY